MPKQVQVIKDRTPNIFMRSLHYLKFAFKIGINQVRFGKTRSYYACKKLKAFRSLVNTILNIKYQTLVKFLVISFLAVMLSSFILEAHPYNAQNAQKLSDLIASGLLIAPLIGMLNGGFTNIVSLYLKVFDDDNNSNTEQLEPRFHRIKNNFALLKSIVDFDKSDTNKKKFYVDCLQDAIVASVTSREDAEFRNSLSTIRTGIFILIGFIILLLNYIPLALWMMLMVYLTLIFKQTSVFRTSIKQTLIEDGLEALKIDYIDDTKQGASFVESYNDSKY